MILKKALSGIRILTTRVRSINIQFETNNGSSFKFSLDIPYIIAFLIEIAFFIWIANSIYKVIFS